MSEFSEVAKNSIVSNIEDIKQRLGLENEVVNVIKPDNDIEKKPQNCMDIQRKPRTCCIHPLNFIIYGAPGTGKTYSTAEYALAIINNREADLSKKNDVERRKILAEYKHYIQNGQIVFTTFHQNYGYEEFI